MTDTPRLVGVSFCLAKGHSYFSADPCKQVKTIGKSKPDPEKRPPQETPGKS
jgi:hypothetical protein